MFFLPNPDRKAPDDLILSASDIVAGSVCEFAAVRNLDVRLGRIPAPVLEEDAMGTLTAALGDKHEAKVLGLLRDEFGPSRVYEVPPPRTFDRAGLQARHRETIQALQEGYEVIYQGCFFDAGFHGRADFLILQEDGTYAVFDTKLARSAKAGALMQLAAYADQLRNAGIPVHTDGHLILGSDETTSHPLPESVPVFNAARDRLRAVLEAHRLASLPSSWGDPRWTTCLKCADCKAEMDAADDLMLVRRMNKSRRAKLMRAGIKTMSMFAAADLPDVGLKMDPLWAELQEQARLQTGTGDIDGTLNGVSYKVLDNPALIGLPQPSPGDIFFDFEGDPLWQDPVTGQWGIEYLFGLLEHIPDGHEFIVFTAHSLAEERQALIDFIDHVTERRATHPDLHIYHYAPYEVSALRKLAKRYGVMEAEVEELIEAGVMFDLYETVKGSVRISDRSFSIKKLEPLYMPAGRIGVTNAVDSMVQYSVYRDAVDKGQDRVAKDIFAAIKDYNHYDCISTWKLRDWLLNLTS
ncbi:TM0106 family RecB-like putative nuclease [Paeniglutamicibacter antarcticus]|uniref:TM0106 family RecB-like putative nuclease n=1 Tax=Arthrobacter terrae TaxID=2935737 RepID=A0A931CN41_9MICC|nr:TM0106 family RecB-like putative nuclease [Arthrobacter terrae]MBG0738951.1 TM0106 family RecB-like putative nuclease [Arthrobacter terrae]